MLLRSIEMKLSIETGTAVRSNVVARMHPRLQYTGMLFSEQTLCSLHVGRPIMLTSDRSYSNYSNASHIYVNATNIFPNLKMFDNIYIGNLKLVVMYVRPKEVECRVVRGGLLQSRMPVVFPPHIDVLGLSWEEVEDIVFCKEMSINYMFSYAYGNLSLVQELKEVLRQLEYTNIKFGACISLNGFKGKSKEFLWMVHNNDAFLLYLDTPAAFRPPEILALSLPIRLFLYRCYGMNKPILFDASEIGSGNFIIHPRNCYFLCFLPDRYLLHRCNMRNAAYFEQLQTMLFEPLPLKYLSKGLVYGAIKNTHIALARNITLATLDARAQLILIAFKDKQLVQKIAHTRPKAQIVCILPDNEQSMSIAINWNITSLVYKTSEGVSFNSHIYEKLLYGLNYAYKCKLIKDTSFIVVVFERESAVAGEFKCEFHSVKFNDKLYNKQLLKLMFGKDGIAALDTASH